MHQTGDFALIVYRNSGTAGIDGDGRPYGETGQNEAAQLDADRKYWPVASMKKPRLRAIVYIVDGVVERIRGVDPGGQWIPDARGYWDIPVTAPLTAEQVAERLPTLGIRLGDHRPHVRGKLREHVAL